MLALLRRWLRGSSAQGAQAPDDLGRPEGLEEEREEAAELEAIEEEESFKMAANSTNINQDDQPDIDCNFIGNYTINGNVREKVDHGNNYEL